jgi:uncharacterized protein
MTTLHPHFQGRAAFAARQDYRLLPFRFTRLDPHRYIVTNDVGEHVVMSREQLVAFARHELPVTTQLYRDLKRRHLLFDDDARVALDLLALKVRTRTAPVANLTGLHIFVVTLRCDHSCHYCQVSRQTEDKAQFDMTREHADKALALVFESPNPAIKIEFQGGEPLLNFELIKHVVQEAERKNCHHRRDLQFVITSNLTHLSDEILAFARTHGIYFSTSLDGPPAPRGCAALMTTTPASLPRITEIIDEYARLGFTSIFLRSLSPYGFAIRTRLVRGYDIAEWAAFYQRGLARILELNRRGIRMREELSAIALQKMFTPSGASYVDQQSPAGVAIGALVYNYNGKIYGSDEGRMLAEMGDDSFSLGSLDDQTFGSVMTNDSLQRILEDSLPESAPMCSDCAFLPWCGADPTFHQATQKDIVGHKAFSAFCAKQMAVLRHLVTLLEDDPDARHILMSWI